MPILQSGNEDEATLLLLEKINKQLKEIAEYRNLLKIIKNNPPTNTGHMIKSIDSTLNKYKDPE